MTVITLKEAQQDLGRFGRLCLEEPVVVTMDGKPAFQLSPLEDEDDDLINQLIETNPRFRELLTARKNEPTISAEEMLRHLEEEES